MVTLLGLAGVIIASVSTPSPNSEEGINKTLAEIERDVAELRELAWKEPVKKLIVTPEELAERVRKLSEEEETATAHAPGGQEQMLKFLQLIPQSMDLKQYTEDLFADGVLGYYDTETKEIVVGAPPGKINGYAKVTLAHELVHALEDQHFDFERTEKKLEASNDGEAEAAFTAVVEGSATLAMFTYARSYLSRNELNDVVEATENNDSEIESAPAILKDSILFPYEAGMDFVSDFEASGGWSAVNKLYKDLPVNTEQIINPARYEQHEVPPPISVDDATPTASATCSRRDAGTIGARDMTTMLQEGGARKEANKAVDAWNGDAYRFDVCGSEKVFQVKVRGDDADGTRGLVAAWEAYGKSWTEGRVKYAPKGDSAARGTALVKAKGDYVAIVLSSDAALASTAMASL
ncbi:MAG: hypothetical protein DCC49_11605 [Acidobacteria bacterium]|nr:MAG: hypothetical protein DCC49_11605 [Acidobacteriota bacterium]